MKCIIPCSGFGTRMNMNPNESKEMLIDPNTNKPIIEYSLQICKDYDLEPLVISRSGKCDLNDYLMKKNIEFILNDKPGEWMDTVLSSSNYWDEDNILLLPDTRFEPLYSICDIKTSLDLGVNSVFALHKVDDVSLWGSIKHYSVYEKSPNKTSGWAWGIIGFKKYEGIKLFNSMRNKGSLFLNNSSFLFLDKFVDITRAGKLTCY